MVTHLLPHDTSTPYQNRPSKSTRLPPPSVAQTPSRRSRKDRGSPYTRTPCKSSPKMELFTPKEFMADRAAAKNRTPNSTVSFQTPMGPPCTPRVVSASAIHTPTRGRSTGTPGTPRYLQLPKTSSPTPEPMFSPPRGGQRAQDRALPTVQLLRVMNKCWEDDTVRLRMWTMRDDFIGGRSDERDRSCTWNTLRDVIHKIWPDLQEWIMKHTPGENNSAWFTRADRIGMDEEDWISDPHIATKHSSLEQVGFFMSQNAYRTACTLVQGIAGHYRDLGCLLDAGISPFFVIYACADCGVSLPERFNLELFWKHLDAILRAQCWRGLGANRIMLQESTHDDPQATSMFSHKDDDPEGILGLLVTIWMRKPVKKVSKSAPVHQVCIAIREGQWIAQSELGKMWFDASDLAEKDVAPFAVLDTLTRVLPRWSGGILQIKSQNVQLLWGVYGPHSGAWTLVRALCKSHHVELRGQWAGLNFHDMRLPADHAKRAALVPVRNENVVRAVMQELGMMKGGNGAYQRMICHLSAGL